MKLRDMLQIIVVVLVMYLLLATVLIVIQLDNTPKNGSISLLAINRGSQKGALASLYLEVKPGNGNVFIDSVPLTKTDTQVATRFAQEIACDILDMDCSNKDFFYYLKSDSAIVGGTSAGAATTLLTMATLQNIPLHDDVIITGSINSGGLVGPVGGVREKIIAAGEYGYKTVLIPKWNDIQPPKTDNESNVTISLPAPSDILDYEDNITLQEIAKLENLYNITIVPVSNIIEALSYFSDADVDISDYYTQKNTAIQLPDIYTVTMKNVSDLLCLRYHYLNDTVPVEGYEDLRNASDVFFAKAENASLRYKHYTAASYCFSANLRLQEAINRNLSQEQLYVKLNELYAKTKAFDVTLSNRSIHTMTDLQAMIITNQRVEETYRLLGDIDTTNISSQKLSYAIERFISARVWSIFFDKGESDISFNEDALAQTCEKKLAEASEKINYLTLILGISHDTAETQLKEAYDEYEGKNYALCIFKSIKSKAEADAVINSLFISRHDRKELLDEREQHIARIIAEEYSRGFFPLLGYSYYEYASDLKSEQSVSAILYQEYAMEFSKLSIYLHEHDKKFNIPFPIKTETLFVLTIGIVLGLILSMMIPTNETKKQKNKPGKPSTTRGRRQSPRKKR